jgi:hypothetical protein
MKWLTKVYKALCWVVGFQSGDNFSSFGARQKARLGGWWWVLVVITLLIIFGLLLFAVWLTIHVSTFKLKKK